MSDASPYRSQASQSENNLRKSRISNFFSSATLTNLLTTFLFGFGLSLILASASFSEDLGLRIGIASGIVSAIYSIAYHHEGVWKRIVYASIVLIAMAFVLSAQSIIGFFANFINQLILAWDFYTDSYVMPMIVSSSVDLLSISAIALFLMGFISLVIWLLMNVRKSALTLLVTIVVVLIYSFIPNVSGLALGAFLIGGLALSAIQTMTYIRFGYTARGRIRLFTGILPTLVIVLVVVVSGLMLFLGAGSGWTGAAKFRDNLNDAIEEYRFGTDTLGEGNFSKSIYMNNTDDEAPPTRLEIEYSNLDDIGTIYFRGFVGSDYTGTAFEQPTYENYIGDWNGLFSWADTLGFDPVLQNAQYFAIGSGADSGQYSTRDISISTINANRKYSYAPYLTLSDDNTRQLLDLYLVPNGFFGQETSYVFEIDAMLPDESFAPAPWVNLDMLDRDEYDTSDIQAMTDFIQAEHTYRAFVYDQYLDVPETVQPIIDRFFTSVGSEESLSGESLEETDIIGSDNDLYTVATRIRSLLESKCLYTDAPSPYDPAAEGDFISWFLLNQQKGNSAAFAVAATLAFRDAGIPARYIEGYMITSADAQALKDAGQTKAALTEDSAHAWVEVYVDGIGFIPIEVTPGFYDKQYNAENVIEISREVVGDGGDSDISGSLDFPWEDIIPEELRPFAWVGLILLIIILLLVVFVILEIQRYIRRNLYMNKLQNALAESYDASRNSSKTLGLTTSITPLVSTLYFTRLQNVLRYAPFDFNSARPFECALDVAGFAEGLRAEEYERMIGLIERERFGSIAINDYEAAFIDNVLRQIEQSVWRSANIWQRFIMRYRYIIDIPLGEA